MKKITIDNKEIEISDELYEVINKATEKECTDWKPKEGDLYYNVGLRGNAVCCNWNSDGMDNFLYSTGNYFKTKEQAQEYADVLQAEIRVNNEIRDKGYRLKNVDWGDQTQRKYSLFTSKGSIKADYWSSINFGEKFGLLKDEESCQALMKSHGEDIKKVLSYNIWK